MYTRVCRKDYQGRQLSGLTANSFKFESRQARTPGLTPSDKPPDYKQSVQEIKSIQGVFPESPPGGLGFLPFVLSDFFGHKSRFRFVSFIFANFVYADADELLIQNHSDCSDL